MNGAAQAIYRHLEHLAVDLRSTLLLRAFAIAGGELIDRARTVALGNESLRPGQALWDPAVAELWALRWNAQLSGVAVPGRESGESADAHLARVRDAVIRAQGWRRSTPNAIRAAARGHLSGTRSVTVLERYQGSAWRAMVVTYTGETNDPDATLADITDPEVVPAGVRLLHRIDPGGTIGQLEDAYAFNDVGDLEHDFPTVGDVEALRPNVS